MNIRIVKPVEWAVWKNLRLEALQNSPESFGAVFAEEAQWSEAEWKKGLESGTIFGAFSGDGLVGCAGFYSFDSIKKKHKGTLWGMYVQPQERGKGVGDMLVQAVIAHAKKHVMQLHLACVITNVGAIKLYQRHGFLLYGTEPRSLRMGETFYDDALMVLKLS